MADSRPNARHPLIGHQRSRNSRRHITDWGAIFPDAIGATAILDRLLHHAAVITINGRSYRIQRHQTRVDQLRDGLADPSKSPL